MKANRRMISLAALLAAGLVLVTTTSALAHPLGNFTVNRYAGLLVQRAALDIDYVVDMAEIPTYQEISQVIGANPDGAPDASKADAYRQRKCAEFPANMAITQNGNALALRPTQSAIEFPPGAGGLLTLRLTCGYRAEISNLAAPNAIVFRDANFSDRIGWREIVVQGDGVRIIDSTAGSATLSNRLRSYPTDLLSNPPAQTEARFKFEFAPGSSSNGGPVPSFSSALDRTQDPFAALITANDLSLPVILLSLALAFALGAAHAVSPGHGKTIMAAYLVGTRGTTMQAILLGMTVTITHTLGVLTLGVITLFASQYILPESLYPWLSLLSGVLVIGMGAFLVVNRLRKSRHGYSHMHDHGDHHHEHPGHEHSQVSVDAQLSWKSLIGLGLAGGLVPSASALILLLSAISLQRIAFGIILIIAFGAGMAAVLVGIGALLVRASSLLERRHAPARLMELLPLISAVVVIGAGIVVTTEAFLQMGFLKP